MRISRLLATVFMGWILTAAAADSPEGLLAKVKEAFRLRDMDTFKDVGWFGVITGDVPMRPGLFNPSEPRSDPDGLDQVFPPLHSAEISLVTREDIGEAKARLYRVGNYSAYIMVRFTLKSEFSKGAHVTDCVRFYPLKKSEEGLSLIRKEDIHR